MGNKILVVDDDPEISSLVQYTLESLGHTVKVCDNGREVMDMLKSYKPELLVLDVMLPGIDGYSLATQISEDEELSKLPSWISRMMLPVEDKEHVADHAEQEDLNTNDNEEHGEDRERDVIDVPEPFRAGRRRRQEGRGGR